MGEASSGCLEDLVLAEKIDLEMQTVKKDSFQIGDGGEDDEQTVMPEAGIVVLDQLLDDSIAVEPRHREGDSLRYCVTSNAPDGNVASLDVMGAKCTMGGPGNVQGFAVDEMIGSSVEIPCAEMIHEGCNFPCPSPRRTPTGDEIDNCLSINADARSRICNTELLSDHGDHKEPEDADRLSESAMENLFINDQPDTFPSVSAVPLTTFQRSWVDGRGEGTLPLGSKHSSFRENANNLINSIQESPLFSMDSSGEVLTNHSAEEVGLNVAGACTLAYGFCASTQVVYKEDMQPVTETCSLPGEQFNKAVPCAAEEDLASQQCHPPVVDYHKPKQLSACDNTNKDDGATAVTSMCSQASPRSVNVSCDQLDDNGIGTVKSDPILIYRRCNPKRAASLRNASGISKLNPATSTKNARKFKKKKNDSTTFLNVSLLDSLKMAPRKKSSHRTGRASVWGRIENLYAMFTHNNGASNGNSELNLRKTKSRKAKSNTARRKSKSRKHDRLKRVSCASTVDSLHSNEHATLTSECLPINNNQTNMDALLDGRSPTQFPIHQGILEDPATSPEKDGHHGERDLESSVTQEAPFENNTGDLHRPTSRLSYEPMVELGDDKLVNNSSTSPESDIIHPTSDIGILANDFTTSTGGNPSNIPSTVRISCLVNSSVQDNSQAGVNNISYVTAPAPSLCLQQYVKRKKKKTVETQESTCPQSGFSKQEKGANDLLHKCKTKKPARSGNSAKKVQPDPDGRNLCNKKKGRRKSLQSAPCEMQLLEKNSSLMEADLLSYQETSNAKMEEQKLASIEEGTELSAPSKDADANVASNASITGESECILASTDYSRTKKGTERRKKKDGNTSTKKKSKMKELERKSKLFTFHREENGATTLCLEGENGSILSGMPEPKDLDLSRNNMLGDCGNSVVGGEVASQKLLASTIALPKDEKMLESSLGAGSHCSPSQAGWVCCDICNKWRCIPAELVDIIKETNCKWTCKDNNDKAFADCHIPQEKTNAEINAELEISDASGEDDYQNGQPNLRRLSHAKLTATQQSPWKRIKSNTFLHRNRKTQNIDEVMVCFCKPSADGRLGCGDGCLNRMLNIECVRGTCPCGDLCSNQQFQKRKYAKLKCFPCGKKGYGLQLLENVSEGNFLIEYVGEVLDMATYESRQKDYASRGQRHFYFMTLNGNEVIDACMKGNLGRFINHSCEPNCRTEKWMVNGEICIGLFAIRDIKKGEELTFDYNYVRVFGAAAKKCICGSPECRGYIGGDPLNSEQIVQDESDEEYVEHTLVCEDVRRKVDIIKITQDTNDKIDNEPIQRETKPDIDENMHNTIDFIHGQHEKVSPEKTDTVIKSSLIQPELETSLNVVEGSCGSSAADEQLDHLLHVPVITSDIMDNANMNAKSNLTVLTNEDNTNALKPSPSKKTSVPDVPMKKVQIGLPKSVGQKTKKFFGNSSHIDNFDGVAKKLKELTSTEGGISKRKDAAKGYLKLLVVTAADNNGTETIHSQSTRDLSLILDALLKTRSRNVLMDIVNKNGLQMLHNIMKQNRKNNNKIPILRKLLKVLKHLVENKVLAQDQINMIPSCAGVESFQDSIIQLTYHNDKEVHHAAREFSEKWVFCASRKNNISDIDVGHGLYDSRHMKSSWTLPATKYNHREVSTDDPIHCLNQKAQLLTAYPGFDSVPATSAPSQESTNATPLVHASLATETKPRKRKSRWDQDKSPKKVEKDRQCPCSNGENGSEPAKPDFTSQHEKHNKSGLISFTQRTANEHDSSLQDNDETPPGFDSPPRDSTFNSRSRQSSCGTLTTNSEVVIGKQQERYLPQFAVSHGIPLGLMQQLGTPIEDGRKNCFLRWRVAPAMPFHPFPPLPPYPRERNKLGNSQNDCSSHDSSHLMQSSGWTERSRSNRQFSVSSRATRGGLEKHKSGKKLSDRKLRMRQLSHNRGHRRLLPPWPRERSGYESKGNRRHEIHNTDRGRLRKKNSASEDAIFWDAGTTFHHQQTHN